VGSGVIMCGVERGKWLCPVMLGGGVLRIRVSPWCGRGGPWCVIPGCGGSHWVMYCVG